MSPGVLWLAFVFMGLVWGSSFYWIKVALHELTALEIISYRLAIGALGLLALSRILKVRFPENKKDYLNALVVALINPTLPFFLITWGETHIDSAVASVLNSTVPLWAIVVAHFTLGDEKVSVGKILGLFSGLFGVICLLSRELAHSSFSNSIALLGVFLAAGCYAIGSVYSKKYIKNVVPLAQTTMVMSFSALVSAIFLFLNVVLSKQSITIPVQSQTLIALLFMGLLGTCVAFGLYFMLIKEWGVTKTSLVNYCFPLVGVLLGAVFFHEKVDFRLILGAVLIVAGVGLVSFEKQIRNQLRRSA